jgi:UDP-glucose 4-epimerase
VTTYIGRFLFEFNQAHEAVISVNQERNFNMLKVLLVGGCGYIGSFLHSKLKRSTFEVTVCDILIRGNPGITNVHKIDYNSLSADFLSKFHIVLWFAGHSSVGQSTLDPRGAIENNCVNLYQFTQKLHRSTKLIYASTASLYSTDNIIPNPAGEDSLLKIPRNNPYDISKFAFDYIAETFIGEFYALRMGTLAGSSPNLREELIFNSMNISALRNGKVNVRNPNAWRTILFLDDLWRVVFAIMTRDVSPGFFNVGSVTLTVNNLAERIAKMWDAEINYLEDTPTYSFVLDLEKTRNLVEIDDSTEFFIGQCNNFKEGLLNMGLIK